MRILLVFLLLIAVVTGCKKKDSIPSGILPPDKMEVVLWDMIRADEFLREFVLAKDSTLNDTLESLNTYQWIFDNHKIKREQFATSFNYYQQNPNLFRKVLDSLISRGNNAPSEIYQPGVIKADTTRLPPRVDSIMQGRKDSLFKSRKRIKKS